MFRTQMSLLCVGALTEAQESHATTCRIIFQLQPAFSNKTSSSYTFIEVSSSVFCFYTNSVEGVSVPPLSSDHLAVASLKSEVDGDPFITGFFERSYFST